jgi:hypothetical protein
MLDSGADQNIHENVIGGYGICPWEEYNTQGI